MKPYFSIDIETTGLNPDTCQVIEIGAIYEDGKGTPLCELPRFHGYIMNTPLVGEPYALSMHPKILRRIAIREDGYNYYTPNMIVPSLHCWIRSFTHDKITIAGKNFGAFDLQFLRKLPEWDKVEYHHRYLDPGNLYWQPNDNMPPSTEECMRRAGLVPQVMHTALADAEVVIELIRKVER